MFCISCQTSCASRPRLVQCGICSLFLRTPVVGADGELACRLDIYASPLSRRRKYNLCEVGDVVLRCGLHKCGHFHSLYACFSLSYQRVCAGRVPACRGCRQSLSRRMTKAFARSCSRGVKHRHHPVNTALLQQFLIPLL